MQTTTIRTAEPRELLALIPFQLGFQPEESAVVISLRGPRARVGLIARVDLADLANPDHGPQIARSLVSHLVADGARRTVLVLYTATRSGPQEPAGPCGAAREHLAEAAEHFLGDPDSWVVTPTGWFNLDCEDLTCCPERGRPLTDLQGTEVGAQMVLSGASVVGSRGQLGRIAPAPPAARRSARRAAARWADRGRAATGAPQHRWRRDGLMLWRSEHGRAAVELDLPDAEPGAPVPPRSPVPGWTPPGSAVLGRLQAALADVLVRDAVMLSFVAGTDKVGEDVVAGEDGPGVGRALRAIIDPVDGVAPEAARVAGARAVLEQVVAHSARHVQAPALTLLAVLAWWEGDGARAGILVERALAAEPGYRLADLVDQTLAAGMPPGWLRATASEQAAG